MANWLKRLFTRDLNESEKPNVVTCVEEESRKKKEEEDRKREAAEIEATKGFFADWILTKHVEPAGDQITSSLKQIKEANVKATAAYRRLMKAREMEKVVPDRSFVMSPYTKLLGLNFKLRSRNNAKKKIQNG